MGKLQDIAFLLRGDFRGIYNHLYESYLGASFISPKAKAVALVLLLFAPILFALLLNLDILNSLIFFILLVFFYSALHAILVVGGRKV